MGNDLFDELWNERRPFSRFEALLYMIRSSENGRFEFSQRVIAVKWDRTRDWVRALLKKLQKSGIKVVSENGTTVVVFSVEQLAFFVEHPSEHPTLHPTEHTTNETINQNVTKVNTPPYTPPNTPVSIPLKEQEIKKEETLPLIIPFKEEINKEEEIEKKRKTVNGRRKENDLSAAKAALNERKKKFYESLVPYVGKYTKEMVREFYDYWTEFNRSQTHMRYELERTWELGKRLATWAKRSEVKARPRNNMSIGVVLHNTDKDYEETRKQLW